MAFNMFLKIDAIEGESPNAKFAGWIVLESFSFGVTNAAAGAVGSGAGIGKASFQDLHVTSPVSKASPKVFQGCATGQHFKKVQLVVLKAGQEAQAFYKVTLSDVLISSYQSSGTASVPQLPVDSFSLNFAKIEDSYSPQLATGALGPAVTVALNGSRNSTA
jgi:type VI secretion system secreted protein Hcp